jgi:hypothetical protein
MSQISWPEGRPRGFQDKEASIEPYSREREKSFTGTSITEDPLPPPDALAVDFKHDLVCGMKFIWRSNRDWPYYRDRR